MRLLTVRHVTIYRYSEPVGLGEHRMMFRPRESHDLRLIKTRLNIMPKPKHLRWLHDAQTRAAHHAWSILAYNCNDFVADVARGIGMQTPTALSLLYNFIPRIGGDE